MTLLTTPALPGINSDVSVRISATGQENAIAFSLKFDPAVLKFVAAYPGSGLSNAAVNINSRHADTGSVEIALALTSGTPFPPGTIEVARLRFLPTTNAVGVTNLNFADSPIYRQVASVLAEGLSSDWQDATVSIGAPVLTVDTQKNPHGDLLLISWSASFANAALEISTNLAATHWNSVNVPPVVTGSVSTVALPLNATPSYFRLKLP